MEKEDLSIDTGDRKRRTPLSYAPYFGHKEIVQLLLDRTNVEADSKDTRGKTPLLYAAFQRHEGIVRLLLKGTDVKVDSKDKDGRTPLSYAAERRHDTIVRLLLESDDVETDSKDEYGGITLSLASKLPEFSRNRLQRVVDQLLKDIGCEDQLLKIDKGEANSEEAFWRSYHIDTRNFITIRYGEVVRLLEQYLQRN